MKLCRLPSLLAFSLICLNATQLSADRMADYPPDKSVVFKTVDGHELQAHIFQPAGHQSADERPAIVFFHGGGWKGGNPSQFFPFARHLADQGMVAISAQYRLTREPGVDPRNCVEDAKSAIRWARENADSLGIDSSRIAAGGGSAGGHLAAATAHIEAFDPENENTAVHSKPDALVLFNPVANNGPGGYGHKRVKDYWEIFSPLHNIGPGAPPTLIMNGTEDHLIPVSDIHAYEARMHEVGSPFVYKLYEGAGHGFFNEGKEHYDPTVQQMDAFLRSLGYIE